MKPFVRPVVIAALGCLAWAASAQELSKAVTLQLGAVPVGSVLAAMEQQTGVLFRTGGGVSKDVVFVSVKNVSAKDFMERLAFVDRAEWQKMDGGYRLTRSDSLVRQLEKEEAQLRAETYKKSIARLVAALRPDLPYTAGDAKSEEARSKDLLEQIEQGVQDGNVKDIVGSPGVSKTPAARAIVALLSKMNPVEFGAVKPNSRIVFATNPTLMQKPLPSGTQETIATFMQEQKTFLESNRGTEGVQIAGPGIVTSVQGSPPPNPNAGPPAKTLLVGQRFGDRDTIMFVLTVYDANGNQLAMGMLTLSGDMMPGRSATQSAAANTKKLELSALAKEVAALLRGPGNSRAGGSAQIAISSTTVALDDSGAEQEPIVFTMSSEEGAPQAKLSDALRERVLHPEKFDPLAILPSELFKAWADSQSKNFLASIPDSLFEQSADAVSGSTFTVESVVSLAKGAWDLDVQESDVWLTVRPAMGASAVAERIDRAAFGKLLRTLATNGQATLDERAAYAATVGDTSDPSRLESNYLKWVNAAAADTELGSYFGGQRDMLKMWGLLSAAQRQSLAHGQPLGLRSLSPAQLKVLDRIVWHSSDGPRLEGGPGGRGPRIGRMAGLAAERTQLLPSGVPGDAVLACQVAAEPAVHAMTADGSRSTYMSAADLARNMAMNERGVNLPSFMNPPAKYEKFRLAQQTNLTFRFLLAPRVTIVRRLDDVSQGEGAFMPFEQLPPALRRRVEENMARTRAALQGFRGGVERRGGPSEAAP